MVPIIDLIFKHRIRRKPIREYRDHIVDPPLPQYNDKRIIPFATYQIHVHEITPAKQRTLYA